MVARFSRIKAARRWLIVFFASASSLAYFVTIGDVQSKVNKAIDRSILTSTSGVATVTKTVHGKPRPQFVFHIQYHKTGSFVTHQYDKAVKVVSHRNANKTIKDVEGTSSLIITDQILEKTETQEKYRLGPNYYAKRTHNNTTGCPSLINFPTYERPFGTNWNKTTSPIKIYLMYMLVPDFFCDLYENDVFLQMSNKNKLSSNSPNHDVKFIHMLRDPFEMAISNYLYHSQYPTPEPWVFEISPCTIDHDMLRLVVEDKRGGKILTDGQIDQLRGLCEKLMTDPETNQQYRNFYQGLQALPFYDGLRLATIFSLVNKGKAAGGDLLRMTNNVLRLNEWQRRNQVDTGASNTVLSLKLDEDWSEEHYGETTDRLTGFILDDLEFLNQKDDVSGAATANIKLRKAKTDFTAMVKKETEDVRLRSKNSNANHFTKDRIDDRFEVKAKLRADELFGPILSRLQTIVDSAYGLKKEFV